MVLLGFLLSFMIIAISHTVLSKLPNFCRLPNGDSGMCIQPKKCPQMKNSNTSLPFCVGDSKSLICCPAIARIVTPDISFPTPLPSPIPVPIPQPLPPIATLPPATIPPATIPPAPLPTIPPAPLPTSNPIPTSYPPIPAATSSLPIIDITTKMTNVDNRIANAKCEEYKHKVIKRASIITYVFGGTESSGKEYPHMAALGYGHPNNVEWLCGGSLVSEQYVLTAAHCLVISSVGQLIVVRLGDLNLKNTMDDASPQDFGVAAKIVHPLYQRPAQYHDIALVKLDRMAPFTSYIAPICLETSTFLPNNNFIATGWGKTEKTGQQSDSLMEVDLEYFPNNQCQNTYALISPESLPYGILDYSQICAGSYTEHKDTCQGDSGGPLQIRDQNTLYLVGITSFGLECGVPNSPAVYTRVSYYVPWIEQNVWPQG